jgi:pimeloyl-ACP methyl ester carboxylesterase
LGSFAATHVAAHEPVDGLVLEGAETNVPEVLGAWTPWYAKPFVRFNIDPGLAAADNPVVLNQYKGPLLIISGEEDKIAPPVFSEHLYNASASSEKRLARVQAGHEEIFDASEFPSAFESFSLLVFGRRLN